MRISWIQIGRLVRTGTVIAFAISFIMLREEFFDGNTIYVLIGCYIFAFLLYTDNYKRMLSKFDFKDTEFKKPNGDIEIRTAGSKYGAVFVLFFFTFPVLAIYMVLRDIILIFKEEEA